MAPNPLSHQTPPCIHESSECSGKRSERYIKLLDGMQEVTHSPTHPLTLSPTPQSRRPREGVGAEGGPNRTHPRRRESTDAALPTRQPVHQPTHPPHPPTVSKTVKELVLKWASAEPIHVYENLRMLHYPRIYPFTHSSTSPSTH